jgi:DNA-binding CsgD family transcriptional regulator
MENETFHKAYETAASELESLLRDQERIEERILSLRKTMNALATLISQHEGKDKNFLDYARAHMRELVDTSLTRDIQRIVNASPQPLTASEIRAELKELGGSLAEHSNPLATIYAILNRLSESGRVEETLRDGKKAWARRVVSLSSLVRATKNKGIELLSARERQVIQHVAEGMSNREIAHVLGLSPHAVENHLLRILDKLGVSSRNAAEASNASAQLRLAEHLGQINNGQIEDGQNKDGQHGSQVDNHEN